VPDETGATLAATGLAIDHLPQDARIVAGSRGISSITHLSGFFGGRKIVSPLSRGDAFIGWGNKASGQKARAWAVKYQKPLAILEDGFMRSVGLGKTGAPAWSIVVDEGGIYYDASKPSRLEGIIESGALTGDPAVHRAALALWRKERLSKYNIGADEAPSSLAGKIILVDQVAGDESISGASASETTFAHMIDAALAEHQASDLVVRTHPDVMAGKAKGFLTEGAQRKSIRISTENLSPHAILDAARAIWTVSSALGFEAILRGVPVTTFGIPFYAGWGLSTDRAPAGAIAFTRRTRRVTVEELFAAAMLTYARYVNPQTAQPLDFFAAAVHICEWREATRKKV
jgi:capsular polysaccharide export protein